MSAEDGRAPAPYRALLRLLPSELREEWGDEMEATFADRLASCAGPAARLATWTGAVLDIAFQAARERWKDLGRGAAITDARFAFRQFRRRWATTVTMLGVLTTGMTITVLLFSVAQSVATLPPPGIERADDLVRIRGVHVRNGELWGRRFDERELNGYQALSGPFRTVAGWANAMVVLDVPGDTERQALNARVSFVTGAWFDVLGVEPVLGSALPTGVADTEASMVAVISHSTWDLLFARSPNAIGSTVDLNGTTFTVIGVTPRFFQGIGDLGTPKLWLPAESRHAVLTREIAENLRFGAVARLAPGIGPEAATAAIQGIVADVGREGVRAGNIERASDVRSDVVRSLNGDPRAEQDVRYALLATAGLAVLVLLITCTNVSALLMGLAMARRHEIVVRLSLGASRGRVVRQLLTESVWVALAAGAGALGLTWLALALVRGYIAVLPLQIEITPAAAAFTLATALGVGILFGLAPALHATRVAMASALQDSVASIAGKRQRLQRVLVVAQIACTQPFVVAVVAAVVMVSAELRTEPRNEVEDRLVHLQFGRVVRDPWVFEPRDVALRHAEEMERVRAGLEATHGIAALVPDPIAVGDFGPYESHPEDRATEIAPAPITLTLWASAPDHFAVVGVPLLRGRHLELADLDARQVRTEGAVVPAIINEALARQIWGDADPIGRRLRPTPDAGASLATLAVAGVVPTPNRRGSVVGEHQVHVLRDPSVAPRGFALRTATNAESFLPAIRRVAADHAPSAIAGVETFASSREEFETIFRRTTSALFAAGAMTLLLSAIGLYAVVAFSVGQRRGEIAVRMAMGARAGRVARGVLVSGLRLSGLGLAIGLPMSLLALQGWNSIPDAEFPEVPMGPVALWVAIFANLTALAASYVPARRAAGVDPAQVLRRE